MWPAISSTSNAAGIVNIFAHIVLYGPGIYQGINVRNLFFLQEIIHIMVFLRESVGGSQIGQFILAYADAFWVEIGIPFSITETEYNEQTFAFYIQED